MVDARRSRAIEDKLLQALTKYLGREIRLVFEVSQSELATPARQRALADQDKVVRAAAAFEADPAVKGLQERFGAEVDAASVKPAQLAQETIMMKGGLGNLMRQAQQMQENMQKAQAELANLEVTGESGAGMVKVVLNGRHEAKKVTIEPKLVAEDLEMLEDLVAAAINDASRKIEERSKEKYADLMSGMNLPPGMKLPF